MFTATYQRWLEPLRSVCEQAGTAILQHYHSDSPVETLSKEDDSPLTEADIASHRIILAELAQTGLPVLSEESPPEDMRARHQWQRFWMVDPLDGTREFLGRTGEFTINIALIESHKPVFGMIALPLTAAVYVGVPGQGAACYRAGTWQPIRCDAPLADGASERQRIVLTSRRHRGEELDAWLAGLQARGLQVSREYMGSALKFCRLAEGSADYYPRFSPCSEWDTAAGQALLEGAGGALATWDGQALSYNRRQSLLNPYFIASGRYHWPID